MIHKATVLLLQLEDIKENCPYKKAKEILERFAAVSKLTVCYFFIRVLIIITIHYSGYINSSY